MKFAGPTIPITRHLLMSFLEGPIQHTSRRKSKAKPLNIRVCTVRRPSTIHRASYRDLNGTGVPQSIDLQTEKIGQLKEPKRQQLSQSEGPGNFVGCSNLIGQELCDVSI